MSNMMEMSTIEMIKEGFFLLTVMVISFGIYFKETM